MGDKNEREIAEARAALEREGWLEAGSTPTIHQLIPKVMASIGAVGKGDYNDFHKFKFRGIDSVVNAVYPALVEHGVFISPEVISADYAEVATSKGKDSRQATLTVRYTVYGPAGDSVECVVVGEAMDAGDKATSKALSMAFKYMLFEFFCIPVEEGQGHDEADRESHERAGKSTGARRSGGTSGGPAAGDTRKPTNPQKTKARMLLIEHGIIHTDGDGVVDDTVYRAAFQRMYGEGVDSTKKLTRPQISALIDSLEKGAKGKPPAEIAAAIIERGVAWIIDEGGEPPKWAVES